MESSQGGSRGRGNLGGRGARGDRGNRNDSSRFNPGTYCSSLKPKMRLFLLCIFQYHDNECVGSRHQTPENADDRLPPRQQSYQGTNSNSMSRQCEPMYSNVRSNRSSRGVPPSQGGARRERRVDDRRRVNETMTIT